MGDLFFIAKAFLITLVVVLLLQIRIGEYTIDENIHHYIKSAGIHQPLEQVARGGTLWIQSAYRNLLRKWPDKLSQQVQNVNSPGNRKILTNFKRSVNNFKDENLKAPEDGALDQENSN